jgi:hypothetical protein
MDKYVVVRVETTQVNYFCVLASTLLFNPARNAEAEANEMLKFTIQLLIKVGGKYTT